MLIVAGLLSACEKREQASVPQIVYAGLGVSNHLEVGMSLKQIGKNNNGLKVTRYWKPDTRPWEKPFKKPQSFEAGIASRGAMVWGFNEAQTFGELRFAVPELPPTLLRVGTNEFSISQTHSITFDEVVQRLGPPRYNLDASSKASLPMLINTGQSSTITNQFYRMLYYPADGVFFNFRSGALVGFSIVRRYADTNTVTSSK